jgi:hypothetical protein
MRPTIPLGKQQELPSVRVQGIIIMQRAIVFTCTLLLSSSFVLFSQTRNAQVDSTCQKLKTCLLTLSRIQEPKNISQNDVDTLVHNLLTYDECVYLEDVDKMVHVVLAKIVESARNNQSFIKSLIILESSLDSTNAYFAKWVSSYILSGAKINPNGFLNIFAGLNEHDSRIVLDCLSKEDNYDLAKIYDNYSNSNRSTILRQTANRISSSWKKKHCTR